MMIRSALLDLNETTRRKMRQSVVVDSEINTVMRAAMVTMGKITKRKGGFHIMNIMCIIAILIIIIIIIIMNIMKITMNMNIILIIIIIIGCCSSSSSSSSSSSRKSTSRRPTPLWQPQRLRTDTRRPQEAYKEAWRMRVT